MKETLRILVVDDDRRMTKTLKDIFEVKGYQVEEAHSGPEALDRLERADFDCVLSDIKMPEVNGVELYRAIKAKRPDLPVVLMTAYSADLLIREGLEEGVVAALTKPLDINQVLSFFSLLRKEQSVVIVDDDPEFGKTLAAILEARGFRVTHLADARDVMEKIESDVQVVVVLDMKLNEANGLDVLKSIRQRHPDMPMVLVTGYREEMVPAVEAALKISAHTCLYKPFEIEELLQVLTEVRHQHLGRALGRRVRRRSRE